MGFVINWRFLCTLFELIFYSFFTLLRIYPHSSPQFLLHSLNTNPQRWIILGSCGMRLTLVTFYLLPGWRSDSGCKRCHGADRMDTESDSGQLLLDCWNDWSISQGRTCSEHKYFDAVENPLQTANVIKGFCRRFHKGAKMPICVRQCDKKRKQRGAGHSRNNDSPDREKQLMTHQEKYEKFSEKHSQ